MSESPSARAGTRASRAPGLRAIALAAHRYVGLALALFLLVAGVTGSLLAFYRPLDVLLNPELHDASPPTAASRWLDPFVLHERLAAQLPPGQLAPSVVLLREAGHSVNYWVDEQEVFVDPYDGEILGRRTFGDVREGRKSLLTFVYVLHHSLALGEVGRVVLGIAALLWTVDCFVGAYLTFPPARKGPHEDTPRRFFARWWPAWLLKWTRLFTLVFTFHRASGLWLWLTLLMFAWSAVALNLYEPVYGPVMTALFDHAPDLTHDLPVLATPTRTPPVALRTAHALARSLMAQQAEQRGFQILAERQLDYLPEHQAFVYTVESSLDVSERLAETSLACDAAGRLLAFHAPTGQHFGSTLDLWLVALHFGAVRAGGLPYRALVCLLGLLVGLLAVSGVWIWWKKRASRVRKARHPGRPRVALPGPSRDADAK